MAVELLDPLDSVMTPNSLRVLIIDGRPAAGRGLKALVGEMPGLHVVGLATCGDRGPAAPARLMGNEERVL